MMPWEHAVVGYVAYSLFVHAAYRDSPSGGEAFLAVFASVLPDLIDKPLAWEFGVLSGYSLGHSVFFAVPLSIVVGVLAARRGRPRLGYAFGIGYLLHLPADVVPAYVFDGEVKIARVLWPLRRGEGSQGQGLEEGVLENVVPYAQQLLDPGSSPYMTGVVVLMVFGLLLWLYDGAPVAREAYAGVRSAYRNARPERDV